MGYGAAKQLLFEAAWNYFASARARRDLLLAQPERVSQILADGARRAREKAGEVLARARRAAGVECLA
jgi:tryptophanyl-tRNA synthetase